LASVSVRYARGSSGLEVGTAPSVYAGKSGIAERDSACRSCMDERLRFDETAVDVRGKW
jgi:hypothetical protein